MKEIAVVEDNNEIREVIGFLLQSDNYNLRMFSDITSFTIYIELHCPNVIVLDVMLPDGNGIEVCKALKRNHATRDIPVILMSANKYSKSREDGAVTFIGKPFDIHIFKETVESYL